MKPSIKKSHWWLAAGMAIAQHAGAQNTIDWFTLDAAGGAHASANYVVNFTAGQTDVGSTIQSSASYQIISGFWALEDMGPATGLPDLSIALSGANVILTWPSPSTGYVLQHRDSFDLLSPGWADTLGLVVDNGFIKTVTVPHNLASRFYRLRRP